MTDDAWRSGDVESVGDPDSIVSRYDWTSTAPHTAVVETVAAAVNRDPVDLEPLYSRVDPDALDVILGPTCDPRGEEPIGVSFTYAGRDVTVESSGEVVVRSCESATDASERP